jgi:hypothetical protein
MNKRLLLALYDRSGLGAYMPVDYKGHELAVEEHMEKFAELIVQECAQLILDKKMGDLGDNPGVKEWEEGYNEAVHDCYYLIRKHFGVEE